MCTSPIDDEVAWCERIWTDAGDAHWHTGCVPVTARAQAAKGLEVTGIDVQGLASPLEEWKQQNEGREDGESE